MRFVVRQRKKSTSSSEKKIDRNATETRSTVDAVVDDNRSNGYRCGSPLDSIGEGERKVDGDEDRWLEPDSKDTCRCKKDFKITSSTDRSHGKM